MVLRVNRLGITFTVSGLPIAASPSFFLAVFFLPRKTPFNGPFAWLGFTSRRSGRCSRYINHLAEFLDAGLTVTPLTPAFLAGDGDRLAEGFDHPSQFGGRTQQSGRRHAERGLRGDLVDVLTASTRGSSKGPGDGILGNFNTA